MAINKSTNPGLKQDNFLSSLIEKAANIGYQRTNKYIVFIHGPDKLSSTNLSNLPISIEEKKRLSLNCISASLPGKSSSTIEFTPIGSGPKTKMPYNENFLNEVTLEFLCSPDFYERKYFVQWMQSVVNPKTHDVGLYSEYAKPWKIMIVMLPNDVSSFDTVAPYMAGSDNSAVPIIAEGPSNTVPGREKPLYFIRLNEVYPLEIVESNIQYDNNSFLTVPVKFAYKYWDDPVIQYNNRIETIRENSFPEDDPNVVNVNMQEYRKTFGIEDQVGIEQLPISPFDQFRKIARDIIRYSNPKELKQLIIDKGVEQLNVIIGAENVADIAKIIQRPTIDGIGDTL